VHPSRAHDAHDGPRFQAPCGATSPGPLVGAVGSLALQRTARRDAGTSSRTSSVPDHASIRSRIAPWRSANGGSRRRRRTPGSRGARGAIPVPQLAQRLPKAFRTD
jgi:hypothetical protein